MSSVKLLKDGVKSSDIGVIEEWCENGWLAGPGWTEATKLRLWGKQGKVKGLRKEDVDKSLGFYKEEGETKSPKTHQLGTEDERVFR